MPGQQVSSGHSGNTLDEMLYGTATDVNPDRPIKTSHGHSRVGPDLHSSRSQGKSELLQKFKKLQQRQSQSFHKKQNLIFSGNADKP